MEEKEFETRAIRMQTPRSENLEHSTPLYLTSSFVFEDAEDMRASFAEEKERNIYSRYANPNTSELIQKICAMEGADAGFAFASGMAAVYSTFAALLESGDHIVSCASVFGSTLSLYTQFFPKWQISTDLFHVNASASEIESLIKPQTKVIYVESPTNPGVDVLDLQMVGDLAKKHGLILIVDNCFASPYLQQPIAFGAHLVVHSATKLIDGQGRVLGGVTVGRRDLIDKIYRFSRISGPAMSPFNAWVLSKSLETLAVRVDRHCDNALALATYLEAHPKVIMVKYPFLKSHPRYSIAKKQMKAGGAVVAFEIKGGLEIGKAFFNNIQMLSLSANLGDSRSIVTHPASTTHAKLSPQEREHAGISEGLIRVSVGLENPKDIIADVAQAIDKATQ
ncbi:MAG: aminotransferase class I/II-fold pyridoxal phosphate-dependent enzyme [Flavobacteriaceae bacterium]|nr:aminotransferase class I/II-fold pyridoxal phosphate-dependent enzyme [Flavobacteriaceae bacterium LSUCC0859]